jgi:hypothetical protein
VAAKDVPTAVFASHKQRPFGGTCATVPASCGPCPRASRPVWRPSSRVWR